MGNSRYAIVLECDHTLYFAEPVPLMGARLWCVGCRLVRAVAQAPHEYRVRCEGCGWSEGFGSGRTTAEMACVVHLRRHPGHVPVLRDGYVIVYRFDDGATVTVTRPERDRNVLLQGGVQVQY